MNGKTIAVFGISGVGKSTLISQFIAAHPAVRHIRASELLLRAMRETTRADDLTTLSQTEIEQNQGLLVAEFRKVRQNESNSNILFDGHITIFNGQTYVVVRQETVKAINPTAILFVEDSVASIAARRERDTSRNRPQRTHDELQKEQALAKATAGSCAQRLKLPWHTITSGDLEAFRAIVTDCFGR